MLRLGRALLCVSLITFAWGCDDDAGTNPGDDDPEMGTGGDMGGDVGGGDMGETGPTLCRLDTNCDGDEYCADPAPGEVAGQCEEGCRTEPDNCGDGEICDGETHTCVAEPCAGDDACAAGEYCDDGTCTMGCREGGCADLEDEEGRPLVCNLETRMCEALFPCCSVDDVCTAELPTACGGQIIDGVPTCDSDPCGAQCTLDSDCPDVQYCNVEDGRCANGCRLEQPELLCNPSEFCDPDKHTCETATCMTDDDCDADRYCDPATSFCVLGCRVDPDNCGNGRVCDEPTRECIEQCDVRDPEGCPAGSYCDPITFNCLEDCFEHADCDVDRYCDAGNNRCVQGCRDDEGELGEPNNDPGTATPIDLVEGENGRVGVAEGRIICGNDSDFYVVELRAGERLRVDVEYDPDAGNLDLELSGDEVADGPIEAATLEVPERIEYPPVGELVQRDATYYIRVFPPGNDPLRRLEYRVTVSVVDAGDPCFPDAGEPLNDARDTAPVVGVRGGTYFGNICRGDLDLLRLNLSPNDALQVQITPDPADAAIEARLYPSTLNAAAARIVLNQANGFRYSAALNDGAFVGSDEWYLRISGLDDETIAEYQVDIVRESADVCDTDEDTEPNDQLDNAVLLDGLVVDEPYAVPLDTAICNAAGPDVDTFCFVAEMGETLEAWLVSPEASVNGQLAVQFTDSRGVLSGVEGRGVEGDEMPLPARVVNVTPGNWCARVRGLDQAQGPYQLFVQRLGPAEGVCANDVAESAGRNDRPSTASALVDVGGDGRRFEYLEGYICDIGAEGDEDWYSFSAPANGNYSLCVMVNDFDRTRADVDLDVFSSLPADGANCQNSSQCMLGRAACIERRCTPPLEDSASAVVDFEMVSLRRPLVNASDLPEDLLLRVSHNDENEGPYQVAVTVTPTEPCGADWQEVEGDNDEMARATPLGAGELGICDTWICADERNTGDWYDIEVPAGEDRTVIINYSGGDEGRLQLNAVAPPLPDDPGSGNAGSFLAAGNHQCLNIRGGDMAAPVSLQITAPQVRLGEVRIDYSLRVVPTDLDARPDGECENLGAPPFDPCPPREEWDELFGERVQPADCWVAIPLP